MVPLAMAANLTRLIAEGTGQVFCGFACALSRLQCETNLVLPVSLCRPLLLPYESLLP